MNLNYFKRKKFKVLERTVYNNNEIYDRRWYISKRGLFGYKMLSDISFSYQTEIIEFEDLYKIMKGKISNTLEWSYSYSENYTFGNMYDKREFKEKIKYFDSANHFRAEYAEWFI